MARKKKGAQTSEATVADEAPDELTEEEGEEVSAEALAKIEARLQARMDARIDDVEKQVVSAVASSAPAETVSLDPLEEEDEDEPTFKSRISPLVSAIPYADNVYGTVAPYAATAWQKVTEGIAKARVHTMEYEQTVAETLSPITAAVAPHVAAAKLFVARLLQLAEPLVVDLDKEAGAELDACLRTSLFTGRVVIASIAASSPALGQISVGDTIVEINGKVPKHATHAGALIKRASPLSLLVQPGKRRIAEVLGPEASDLAVFSRSRWRCVLCFILSLWLIFSVTNAPAEWMRERGYRSQIASTKAQLRLSALSADLARKELGKSRLHAMHLDADNATAHMEYDKLAVAYERMKKDLLDEKARHRQEVARARQDASDSATLRTRQQALRQKFLMAKSDIEKKWRDYQAELQKAANALETPAR